MFPSCFKAEQSQDCEVTIGPTSMIPTTTHPLAFAPFA